MAPTAHAKLVLYEASSARSEPSNHKVRQLAVNPAVGELPEEAGPPA